MAATQSGPGGFRSMDDNTHFITPYLILTASERESPG